MNTKSEERTERAKTNWEKEPKVRLLTAATSQGPVAA
jgi:hypothetical protein